MPLKTDTFEEPNLNLTPMIDIVFLLIIFFMVGTRFARDEPTLFDIELATTATESALTPGPDPVVISVSADGTIRMNQQPMTLEELEAALRQKKQNYKDQAVIIGGEAAADLQNVVNILDICKRLDIKRFTLAARTQDSG